MADEANKNGIDGRRMTLWEHLEELRRRILLALAGVGVALAVSLFFAFGMIAVLKKPYLDVMRSYSLPQDLTTLDVTSPLTIYFKTAFYGSLVLSAPWVFYQLWLFISAGLRPKEKRYVLRIVPFSAALFMAGAVFFLAVASKPALYFLVGFNRKMGVNQIITFENHINFMLDLMLVFALGFQTPLLILVLGVTHLTSIKTLKRYRRHVVVVIVIVAALITPTGDPVNQMVLAVPMYLLYELGVLLVWLAERRKQSHERSAPE